MVSAIASNVSGLNSQIFSQIKQAQFAKADQNGDGGLTFDEFKAGGPPSSGIGGAQAPQGAPSVEEVFSNFDANSDGSLSQSELESGFEGLMSQFGGNKVSGQNLLQLLQEQENLYSSEDDEESTSSSSSSAIEDLFDFLDRDKNGEVSLTELEEGQKTLQSQILSSLFED